MADGLNSERARRVADLLLDFRTLQLRIASAPTTPSDVGDYYTEGWAVLRQCALDGQYILDVAADTQVPSGTGSIEEQERAELQQVLLDAYARRHEAQKIWLRQGVAQRWLAWRDSTLQGQRPNAGHTASLLACDRALRAELASIVDESIHSDMRSRDYQMGRWTFEDPTLGQVQHWVRTRR